MNTVQIICRLTRSPETLTTDQGTQIAKLRVAVNGRDNTRPVFADVKCFGKLAAACGRYLDTGKQIAVEGRLAHDEWATDDGGKRSKLYVIAERVEFLQAPRNKAGNGNGTDSPETPQAEIPAEQAAAAA